MYDNTFAVTKAGATVTFNFTGSGAGETYFNINGLDYEGAAQFQRILERGSLTH